MSAQKLITEHLDLWTSAITKKSTSGRGSNGKIELTGIKKLRELILELAVRGKLVEQDTTDEPASTLLEQVNAYKAKLVMEGRIKKQKKLAEIEEQEKTYDLPAGWQWVRMEAISEYIQRGKGPKYAESGKVRVISQKCVQWSGFNLEAARFVTDSSLDSYQEERYIQANDILWNSTGTGTVGRAIVIEQQECSLVADSHVTIIRPLISNPRHILNYILSPSVQQRIEPNHENSLVSGTTKQVELNSSSVKMLTVPLPPLNEQHRIVQKVDELMALCDRLEQQTSDQLEAHETLVDTLLGTLTQSENATELANNWARLSAHFDTLFTTEQSIDKLKQTILQLAVMGRLVEQDTGNLESQSIQSSGALETDKLSPLPHNWKWLDLGSIADVVRGGSPRPAGDPRFYDGSIPFLKVGDITRVEGKFVTNHTYTIKEAGLKKTRFIEDRTVLLSNSGATLGVPAICEFPTAFNDGIAAFINLSNSVFDEYLHLFLKTKSRWFLEFASRGQGQPNLNTDIIKSTVLPLPPKSEQHHIVQKADELITLCDQLKERLVHASQTRCQLAEAVVKEAVA